MKNVTVVLLLILSSLIFAQSSDINTIKLPNGLGISNQMEYSYDTENENEILENWFNMDYRYGVFSTGIRFDVFQPNDPDRSISRGKERYADISYKYLRAKLGNKKEGMDITVGNFYAMFGRGMILKSYEDRSIRVDNNLLGVKAKGNYHGLEVTMVSGMPENIDAERTDVFHAFDMEYRLMKKVKVGATYALNRTENENNATTRLASLRFAPSIWNFDFYAEYGRKFNDDIQHTVFNDDEKYIGEAYYGNVNFYYGSLGITAEYKKYDNFSLKSGDQSVQYNTGPALRRDHQYILLNRHLTELNMNNEQGYQVELVYSYDDYTQLTANYSYTETLGEDSFYKRELGSNREAEKLNKEAYFNVSREWNPKFTSILAFGYGEEYATFTKSLTPIVELRYYMDEINSFKMIVEHQFTKELQSNETYYDDVLVLEYLRSPKFSVSLVTEVKTTEPTEGNELRKVWSFVQFGYQLWNHTDVMLLAGSRQAGTICIGGVCRYEPEFRGVELKMQTRLF